MTITAGEQTKRDQSLSLLESVRADRVRFSRRLFGRAVSLDPNVVGNEHLGVPTNQLGEAVTKYVLASSPDLPEEVGSKERFLATGIDETATILDPYVMGILKTRGIDAARSFVTHPHSADAVAKFAGRSQNETIELLATSYSWLGFDMLTEADRDALEYLTLDKIPAGESEKRCPFSRNTDTESRRPLFDSFVGWTGLMLVASKMTPRVVAHDVKLRERSE